MEGVVQRLHPASGTYPKVATVPYWRFTWNWTCAWQALWLITSVPSWQFLSSTGCVNISRKLLTDKILKGDNILKTAQFSSLFVFFPCLVLIIFLLFFILFPFFCYLFFFFLQYPTLAASQVRSSWLAIVRHCRFSVTAVVLGLCSAHVFLAFFSPVRSRRFLATSLQSWKTDFISH